MWACVACSMRLGEQTFYQQSKGLCTEWESIESNVSEEGIERINVKM
jgi:hypothetical protein